MTASSGCLFEVSSKHQVTLPVRILTDAGLAAGDKVVIRVVGRGRIEVERAQDVIDRYAGSLPAGTYPRAHVDQLRDEWRAQGTDATVDAFLDEAGVAVIAIDRAVACRAADLRARHPSLRLPDAMSLAVALEASASFLTLDKKLQRVVERARADG